MIRLKQTANVAMAAGLVLLAWGQAAAQVSAPAAGVSAQAQAHAETKAQTGPAPAVVSGGLHRGEGLMMLDYQSITVPHNPSLDLLGFHVLNRVADGLYLGVGAYAPVFQGEYGGFMAFDVGAHVQRRLWGRVFGDAGLSIGGGGGGKSTAQSIELSGTGGFAKLYAGLGMAFDGFSLGANLSRMKFKQSAIDNTQLNVFLQIPFSYTVASFADFGNKLAAADALQAFGGSQGNTLTLGLDNYRQINPQGSNKSTINLVDLQFAHDLNSSTYWYASLGVGYRGIPLYNQLIGGLGHRIALSPRITLHGQLGVGSGGYAPEKIDTGAGLLVYPKLSAEYAVRRDLGVALTAGYLFAPNGSSRNHTVGMALNYHLQSGRGADAPSLADGAALRGYRLSLLHQTLSAVQVRGVDRASLQMLAAQFDTMVSDHVYIPIRAGVALNAYLGYPGYGEVLVGVGLQNKFRQGDRLQYFGQLLGGTNVHGLVVQPGVGLNLSWDERLALYASAGRTMATSSSNGSFRSNYLGLGLSYRFSVPSW